MNRKGTVLAVWAPVLLQAILGASFCLADSPCDTVSVGVVYEHRASLEFRSAHPCGDADLVWAPGNPADSLVIHVTALDDLGGPLSGHEMRLDVSGVGDPADHIGSGTNIGICGSTGGLLTLTDSTDAAGAASYVITGGGCGRLVLDWRAVIVCPSGPGWIFPDHSDTLCVKSPDFNGNLNINFVDIFKYLPMLSSGSGWCGDLNCDGDISFPDHFRLLPHLASSGSCPGGPLPSAALGECP